MGTMHTSGPWKVAKDGAKTVIIYNPGEGANAPFKPILATMNQDVIRARPDIAEANARLIAAAPELLAALQAIYNHLKEDGDCLYSGAYITNKDVPAHEVVRAVIAKATGEKP